jgi:DUF1707 SHOCT-like domain/2TM domain
MTTEVAGAVRASDADRDQVAAIVAGAVGKGLLTLVEADERLAKVYAARYVSDLAPITADLPDGGRPLAPIDLTARAAARASVARHISVYALGVAAVLAIWFFTGAGFFWPAWPIFGFGFGVFAHARAARHAGDPTATPAAAGDSAPAGRQHRYQGCGAYRKR